MKTTTEKVQDVEVKAERFFDRAANTAKSFAGKALDTAAAVYYSPVGQAALIVTGCVAVVALGVFSIRVGGSIGIRAADKLVTPPYIGVNDPWAPSVVFIGAEETAGAAQT